MKNNMGKIFAYAAIAFVVLMVISLFAGILAWIWSKIVIGFVAAIIVWLVQYIRNKPVRNHFILWWGIWISAMLVCLDLLGMFIARYSWLIFVALIIGVIVWAYSGKSKTTTTT